MNKLLPKQSNNKLRTTVASIIQNVTGSNLFKAQDNSSAVDIWMSGSPNCPTGNTLTDLWSVKAQDSSGLTKLDFQPPHEEHSHRLQVLHTSEQFCNLKLDFQLPHEEHSQAPSYSHLRTIL